MGKKRALSEREALFCQMGRFILCGEIAASQVLLIGGGGPEGAGDGVRMRKCALAHTAYIVRIALCTFL